MQLDLTDPEAEALTTFLRRALQEDPREPGVAPLSTILKKLDPFPQQSPPRGGARHTRRPKKARR
jgi:hypothetical protein